MSTSRTYDVVIVGGGVMGSSVAYWLAREKGVSVAVVERDPGYATASSALSASSIRQQFSTPICIAMSRFGMNFFHEIGEHLSVDGIAPDIGLIERGYLYLADQAGKDILSGNAELQTRHGASVALMSPDALGARFDWLNTADLAVGCLGLAGEGWFDGYALLQAFKAKARALGAVYKRDEAVGFARDGTRITTVKLASGEHISAGTVVNATGPYAAQISGWAEFAIPIAPERRTVFVIACRNPPGDSPLVIDPNGLWFRPEGQYFITGGSSLGDNGNGPFDLTPDYAQFEDFVWPALAHRVPAFETIKMQRAWAGHYEMNLFDHNALIGWTPGTDNLFVVAGFSGHGMQHAAAAGRGVAEMLWHGAYQTLDLSPLSPDRLLTGNRIDERNII